MEIKSYIKHIPQKPITPPPLEQKRITLDLSFEEFLLLLAACGMCHNDERIRFFAAQVNPEYKHLANSPMNYHLYKEMRRHAEAANLVASRTE